MAHARKSNILSRRTIRLSLTLTLMGIASWAALSDNFFSREAQAANFVVTNTNDTGPGSLRAAIVNANNNGTGTIDTITFNIPGSGVKTIKPVSELPAITTQTVIDGYSQPGSSANTLNVGNNAVLLIEIDGSLTPEGSSTYGLILEAVGCTVKGLVINNFSGGPGLDIASDEFHIRGNFIGTDPTGTIARPNDYGISVSGSNGDIGWTTPADRNLISGNKEFGLVIHNVQNNKVFGNYIGTNASGTQALGNETGVSLWGSGHTIGGTTVTTRNVIAGNVDDGVQVGGSNHTIRGNYIGVNATATSTVGNLGDGINISANDGNTIGGAGAGAGNIISGNQTSGIRISSPGNQSAKDITIQGNFIGTDPSGTLDWGNKEGGIRLNSTLSNVKIGGAAAGESNTIAFNEQGITASGNLSSTFSANKIYSNDKLGIDLHASFAPDGVTPNDVNDTDNDANGRQNFPVLTSAPNTGGITTINGTLNSTANAQFIVEFYVNPTCDASGYGEGLTYLGSTTATTVGNDVTFTKAFPGSHVGQFVTATATGPTGTSEFSQCLKVFDPNSPPTISINDISRVEGNVQGLTTPATFTVTLSKPSAQTVTVTYHSQAGTATSALDYQFTPSTLLSFAPGETSKAVTVMISGDTYHEPDETFFLILSQPTNGTFGDNQGQATIINDDAAPSVTITDATVAEGNTDTTNFNFTVTLSYGSAQSRSVDFLTVDGTTTSGDYQPQGGTLTFDPGQTQKTITVLVKGDTDVEPDETFFVNLSNPGNATIAKAQGLGTITNDDNAVNPAVELNQAAYSVQEDGVGLNINVTRSGDTSGAASVDYATSDNFGSLPCHTVTGMASQRCDYQLTLGTIRFAAGETSKTIYLPIIDDSYLEGVEVLTFDLSNPVGLTLGAISSATITIFDNDNVTGPNPVDNGTFFIRQQYLDFLGREPEAAGLQFYLNILNGCQIKDDECLAYARGVISANFVRSPEFQRKGAFIMYLYMVTLGQRPAAVAEVSDPSKIDRPHYLEFMHHLQSISDPHDDLAVVDAAKNALMVAWLQRSEIQAIYGGLTHSQFVEKLESTAGVTLANENALIAALNSNSQTRAQVLRAVVESPEVSAKFYKQAFVTMEYFGYLRREPEVCVGSADPANCGFIFHNNRFLLAADPELLQNFIVRGFIESSEYRKRFGP